MDYLPRVADEVLAAKLSFLGGAVLQGPRGCGKTWTGLRAAKSSVRLDRSPTFAQAVAANPSQVLGGDTPRLIDEWQLAPDVWNVVRHEIDARSAKGQFILSGSATPADDLTRHTGAGRLGFVRMRTMTWAELRWCTPTVSLRALHAGTASVEGETDCSVEDIADHLVHGGWPSMKDESTAHASLFNSDYLANVASVELSDTGVRRDPRRMTRLLMALSRNLATEVRLTKLAAEVGADGSATTTTSMRGDLAALERIFTYEPLPAWAGALRSRSRLRKSEKIHLADPALALAALGVGTDTLLADRNTMGFMFESAVIHHLRVFAQPEGGEVFHYRDNTDHEVDAIVDYGNSWGAVEVKLGAAGVAEGERSLLRLAENKVDTTVHGDPRFLAVVTGTDFAYTLPSGVHVIPLACLGA